MARPRGPAVGGEAARAQRDLLRLVGDALEIGGALDEGEHEAQVAGRGLAARDDLSGKRVDRALEVVDLLLVREPISPSRRCTRSSSSSKSLEVCGCAMRRR
jgi:hypothetical protein